MRGKAYLPPSARESLASFLEKVVASCNRAHAKHPALMQAGSEHHAAFWARMKELLAQKSDVIRSPDLPETIAEETRPVK